MKKKVVHLVYSFGMGGLERVIANLINDSDERAVEHIIVTQIDDHSFANRLTKDVKFFCIDKKEGADLGSHWRLFKLLRRIKPDVLHTYNFGVLEYQLVGFAAGVKVRVHADHGRQSSYQKIDNPLKYELFRRLVAVFMTYYVVVSQDLLSWAKDRLKLRAPKLNLVYNGIALEEFLSVPKSGVGEDVSAQRFVCVGRLVDVKNHRLLIDAFARAKNHASFKKASLVIVGDGPNYDQLQQQVIELGLSDSIQLLGLQKNVSEILRASDVFVLPSRYEAQPMTVLEAMACRLPIIATDVGGVSTIVKDGTHGWLVETENEEELADALLSAVESPQRLSEYGQAGANLVSDTFSVGAMSKAYNELYGVESLVEREVE